jgi:hypothetical protein
MKMQKRTCYFTLIALAMTVAILDCNLPGTTTAIPENTPVIPPDTSGTSVALTVQAELTKANPPQLTSTPTVTPVTFTQTSTNPPPTATQQPPTATLTQVPCNQASFVSDVSVPDGTVFETGQAFTKTWRLKNTGSCTWNSSYQLVFVNGDQMNGPGSQTLTSGTVAPNSTVDVSVNMFAPASGGTYRGYWKIREPGGATFGVSTGAFWVEIKAENPSVVEPPPATGTADLVADAMQFAPTPGQKDQVGYIQVRVTNSGTAAAGQFTVAWLSNQDRPGCSWTVPGLAAGASKALSCTFTYTTAEYPAASSSFTVSLVVDTGSQVVESNEGNNSRFAKWTVVRP